MTTTNDELFGKGEDVQLLLEAARRHADENSSAWESDGTGGYRLNKQLPDSDASLGVDLLTLLACIEERDHPLNWTFDVVRDSQGLIARIVATAVK